MEGRRFGPSRCWQWPSLASNAHSMSTSLGMRVLSQRWRETSRHQPLPPLTKMSPQSNGGTESDPASSMEGLVGRAIVRHQPATAQHRLRLPGASNVNAACTDRTGSTANRLGRLTQKAQLCPNLETLGVVAMLAECTKGDYSGRVQTLSGDVSMTIEDVGLAKHYRLYVFCALDRALQCPYAAAKCLLCCRSQASQRYLAGEW